LEFLGLLKYLNESKEEKMQQKLRQKILEVCERKIAQKGDNVGLSFYAFFANKNDDPELLMEAATWWIMTHKFDHFEKAEKIKRIVEAI
jgi:cadmium resistance protein CadD (predicted permease)